jgi:hypothetical protein
VIAFEVLVSLMTVPKYPTAMSLPKFRLPGGLLPLLLLTACDGGGSGLQQRLAQAEAQRDERDAKVKELEKQVQKLQERITAPSEESSKTVQETKSNSAATVTAQAEMMGRDVQALVKPDTLKVFGEVMFTGFLVERGDGSFAGASVPFFGDGQGGWRCGLSKEQIRDALLGRQVTPPATASTAVSPAPLKAAGAEIASSNTAATTSSASTRSDITVAPGSPPVPDWLMQKVSSGSRLSYMRGDPSQGESPHWREMKATGIMKMHPVLTSE